MTAQPKLAAIETYLNEHFPQSQVEQKHDFDRDAQTFKVHLGHRTLLLKVSDEFIDDNTPEEIRRRLDESDLAKALESATEAGILVTSDGLKPFRRGG